MKRLILLLVLLLLPVIANAQRMYAPHPEFRHAVYHLHPFDSDEDIDWMWVDTVTGKERPATWAEVNGMIQGKHAADSLRSIESARVAALPMQIMNDKLKCLEDAIVRLEAKLADEPKRRKK